MHIKGQAKGRLNQWDGWVVYSSLRYGYLSDKIYAGK